jgi:polyisoprenoid-binding protein YceI
MTKFSVPAAIAALVLTSLSAGAALSATRWTVDKTASRVGFEAAMNGEGFTGAFKRYDAQISFDPKDLKGSKAVVSIDMTSALTNEQTRDESLPTPDWFNAEKFPRATFISKGFTALGGGKYQAAGDLTLRGVTKPIILPFTLVISGDTAKMTSAIIVNRLVFGVGQGQWKTEEAIPARVTVRIALTAKMAR